MSEVPPDVQLEDKSLGELVALMSANVSRLIKSEIELAKLELMGDAKRAALGSTMMGAAGLFGGLFIILLCFTAAYGLMAAGVWDWLAFLIVTLACAAIAGILILIGARQFRKSRMSGLRATRRTVSDDLALLRRSGGEPPAINE